MLAVVSVSTQNQSSLSLSEDSKSQLENSLGTLSDISQLLPQSHRPSTSATSYLLAQTSDNGSCGPGNPRDKNTFARLQHLEHANWIRREIRMPISAQRTLELTPTGSLRLMIADVSTHMIPTWVQAAVHWQFNPQQQAQWHP